MICTETSCSSNNYRNLNFLVTNFEVKEKSSVTALLLITFLFKPLSPACVSGLC